MKNMYPASLYKNGLLGGGLYIADDKITFRTGKFTVPPRLRNLELYYTDMDKITADSIAMLPAVSVSMKNGEIWRFVVFGRKGFMQKSEAKLSALL